VEDMEQQKKSKYFSILKSNYIFFTIAFVVMIPIVFFPFIREDKSFVWGTDGIYQHYPILVYYGNLLKELLSGKGFPMFDFSIGLGFDTISTLHYYVIGDPIALLSIFMTPENSVYLYGVLIVIRFYLAGLAFIYLCRFLGKKSMGVTLGAFIYIFSGYGLFAGVRHPYFLNPMIYLPLLIIGLEKVLRKKKPTLLIIMAFVCSISNFYFLFILSVAAVIYCIFRYICLYHVDYKNKFGGLILTGLKIGGYYLLGIAMSFAILLPVLYAFSLNGRLESGGETAVSHFFYNKRYYVTLLQSMFAIGITPGYWVRLSFPSIMAVSFCIMVLNKKYKKLTIAYFLGLLGLLVPFFGLAMNGLSYISNRWGFIIGLIVGCIFAFTYESLFELKKKEIYLLIIGVFGYGILTYAFRSSRMVKYEFIILIATVIAILLLQIKSIKRITWLPQVIVIAIVFGSIGLHGILFYDTKYNGYVKEFLTKEEVHKRTYSGVLTAIKEIEDNNFYRIETYGDKSLNEAMAVGFFDVSAYFSLMDGKISDYLKGHEVLSLKTAYRFHDLDNRTILNTLSSVKYLVTTDKRVAPFAYKLYKEMNDGNNTYYIYENLLALPLGYVYNEYLLEEEYNELPVLNKQNAMLNAVVLDKDSNYIKKTTKDMSEGIKKLDVTIIPDKNIQMDGNVIKVNKPGATIRFEFEGIPKAETYISLSGFNIKTNQSAMINVGAKGQGEVVKYMNLRSKYYATYFGKEEHLINTGYSRNAKSWALLSFPSKQSFYYDDIDVYALDMESYKREATNLRNNVLDNVVLSRNGLTGSVILDNKGIMLLTIPYSKGFRAFVDGKETELMKGNIMYTALKLDSGTHKIEIKYETPYLKLGGIVSGISFMIFIGIIYYNRKVKET
jgi:uncharacterized membrane protein YfhO